MPGEESLTYPKQKRLLDSSAFRASVLVTVTALFSAVFGLSALDKILHFYEFRSAITSYEILSSAVLVPFGILVVVVEVAVTVLIWIQRIRRYVFAFTFLLILAFLTALSYRAASGTKGDCGCFLVGYEKNIVAGIAIDLALLVLCLAGVIMSGRVPNADDR